MITNPEDTGIYNPQIDKYVEVLHEAGALAFTDQANANGILGFARARDAGLRRLPLQPAQDLLEPARLRGPGDRRLPGAPTSWRPYLPVPIVVKDGDATTSTTTGPRRIGRVRGFLGNWMGVLRAYAWIRNLGPDGLARSPRSACSTTTTSTAC